MCTELLSEKDRVLIDGADNSKSKENDTNTIQKEDLKLNARAVFNLGQSTSEMWAMGMLSSRFEEEINKTKFEWVLPPQPTLPTSHQQSTKG